MFYYSGLFLWNKTNIWVCDATVLLLYYYKLAAHSYPPCGYVILESMNLVNSVTCYLYQFALHSFIYIVATHVYPISLISLEQKIHWTAFLLYTLHAGIHQNIKSFSLFSARNTNKYSGSSTGQWTYYHRHILVKIDGVKYTPIWKHI